MYKLIIITIYTIIFYFLCYKITSKTINMTTETINMFKTDFYTSMYFIVVFICLLISIVHYLFYTNYWLINIFDIFPVLLLIISGLIEYNAIYNLKENYYPQIGPEKRIVKTGVYRIIRHPIYLCAILLSSGIILLLSKNIYFYLIIPVIIAVVIKVEHEDNYLLKKHKSYKKYKNKTYKLIPFIY